MIEEINNSAIIKKMAIKPKYGYYPENFDLEKFCKKYSLPTNKVVSILHLFIIKPFGQENSRAITLNATLLRKRVGNIYKKILDALIIDGVIENTIGYEIGHHSRAFQLSDLYYLANDVKKHSIEANQLNEALIIKNINRRNLNYINDLKLPKIKRNADLPEKI